MTRLAAVGAALVVAGVTLTAADPPIAATTGGSIRGSALAAGGASFKGVPFGGPPTGNLRWREPAPVVGWKGTRDATSFAAPCAQSAMQRPELAAISSEDCLYLNVWTPSWPVAGRGLPVDRVPKGREKLGATHASDVPYVFGVFAAARVAAEYDARDDGVSDMMQRYWTNFARTGNPNGPGLAAWPEFDPTSRRHLAFTDSGAVARDALRRAWCDVYIEHVTGPGRNQPGIWVGLR